ncbi:hypothetical protein ACWKWC_12145 [Geodermatophilus nigrescens]
MPREQAQMMGRRRARPTEAQSASLQVRLFPDYMALWPLWLDDMRDPNSLGMSQPLAVALKDWQKFFDQHFHHDGGWDTPHSATWFDNFGYRLLHWIQAELPELHVKYDRWANEAPESRANREARRRGGR